MRRPQKYKKCKNIKHIKTEHRQKTYKFRRFHAKRTSPLNSAHLFTYCSTGQKYCSTCFSNMSLFVVKFIKTILIWCFGGLGLCSNDLSKRKASYCIYQRRNRYRETHLFMFRRSTASIVIVASGGYWAHSVSLGKLIVKKKTVRELMV